MMRASLRSSLACLLIVVLAACTSGPPTPEKPSEPVRSEYSEKGQEIAIYALGLIDTGYRFGGKNTKPKKVAVKERVTNFQEILSGYTGEQAMREAVRCLRCDIKPGHEDKE